MLTIYRRHVKRCEHKHEGRKYRRCRCPIWADGSLNGVEIREALDLRDWEKAQQRIHEWEAAGRPTVETEEVTIEQACQAFENDAKARGLREPTLKNTGFCSSKFRPSHELKASVSSNNANWGCCASSASHGATAEYPR